MVMRQDKIQIILDEEVLFLQAALRSADFKVLFFVPGMADETFKEWAECALVATTNSSHFVEDAVRCGYDVLSLDYLKCIDTLPTIENKTVQHIVKAIRESEVATRQGNYKLTLKDGEQGEAEWRLEQIFIGMKDWKRKWVPTTLLELAESLHGQYPDLAYDLEQLLSPEAAMNSRGLVVLDENLFYLEPFLEERNIRAIKSDKVLTDFQTQRILLANRLLITDNSKDFVDDASSLDLGIIATENIKFKDGAKLAKLISDAIICHWLWAKRHGFILALNPDGKHRYRELVD